MSPNRSQLTSESKEPVFWDDLSEQWKNFDRAYRDELWEKDSNLIKIGSMLSEKDLKDAMKHFKKRHYEKFLYLFITMQSESLMWPGVTWHQAYTLLSKLDIYSGKFTLASIDSIFHQSNVCEEIMESRNSENSPLCLLRYEFMEFVIRIAMERYWLELESSSVEEALDKFAAVCFKSVSVGEYERNGPGFRNRTILGDQNLCTIVQSRYADLKQAFELAKGKKDHLTLQALTSWLEKTQLIFSEFDIIRELTLSKLPPKEEVSHKGGDGKFVLTLVYNNISRLEFIETLVRLCWSQYSLKEYEEPQRLAYKLDILLTSFDQNASVLN